jgi:undecaprenyl-diphosphatase
MSPLDVDRHLVHLTRHVQTPALTWLFVLLSAWWVRGPLLIGIGLGVDLCHRRPPLTALAAAVAFGVASAINGAIKVLVGRPRPTVADPHLHALIAVPSSPSFPSGHAATAFAAAVTIARLAPRVRWWVLGLAALVALSRVYLRVHYPLDILGGALIGIAVGLVAARVARRALSR